MSETVARPTSLLLKLPVSQYEASSPGPRCNESSPSRPVNGIGDASWLERLTIRVSQDAPQRPLPELCMANPVRFPECREINPVGQGVREVPGHA